MARKELVVSEENESIQHRFDAYIRLIIRRRVENQVRNYIRYCRRYDVVSMDVIERISDESDEIKSEPVKIYAGGHLVLLQDEEIAGALYQIKKNKRDILLRNIVEGQSLIEVADILDMSYETVRTYKKRAIKEMREKLEEKGKE